MKFAAISPPLSVGSDGAGVVQLITPTLSHAWQFGQEGHARERGISIFLRVGADKLLYTRKPGATLGAWTPEWLDGMSLVLHKAHVVKYHNKYDRALQATAIEYYSDLERRKSNAF